MSTGSVKREGQATPTPLAFTPITTPEPTVLATTTIKPLQFRSTTHKAADSKEVEEAAAESKETKEAAADSKETKEAAAESKGEEAAQEEEEEGEEEEEEEEAAQEEEDEEDEGEEDEEEEAAEETKVDARSPVSPTPAPAPAPAVRASASPAPASPAPACGIALRLFVCQKDESVLLRPWLEHALSLVDVPRDIFLVDDDSHDPGVLSTLDWAQQVGVRVLRVRPPQPNAFERKNMIFTEWVRSHPKSCNAFFIPMDCDEFLAYRENDARAMLFGVKQTISKLPTHRIGMAVLPLSVQLSTSRDKIRNVAMPKLAERGFGTIYIKRFRNFSHAQGYFSSVAESKWCGINRKIIVYGGGSTVLSHPNAIANRGYHDTSTGRQLGWGNSLCFVEFHNLPHHIRQYKSAEMAKVAAPVSLDKYITESQTSKAQYQREQEQASHMRPSAHSPEFAKIMAHLDW
jgi:chemotaxis protein histidine kinase CheA